MGAKNKRKPPSDILFADLRTSPRRSVFDKLDDMLSSLGVDERFTRGNLVAIKIHFGEKGNTSFVPPIYARRVVDRIRSAGALPFLTDTNTLYVGTRTNSISHIRTAVENGFDFAVAGAPIIIADGLRGESGVDVEVSGRHMKKVSIGREIVSASGLAVLTHFKCHELSGFGGAIKNIGMGCASRQGKLAQHSSLAPVVDPSGCTACGECKSACPVDAIDVGKFAVINENLCYGCGHCIAVCPEGTIRVQWNADPAVMQEKMAEHAAGALKGKENKSIFLNLLARISPFCDCYGHSDAPIVPDIGILASLDPVAIDQASADMVNSMEGLKATALASGFEPGGDKFRGVHPTIDWTVQLKSAEALGLGTREYTIKKI